MFDSIVLDVIISLVFIYLLYSLLATLLGEIISTRLHIRARVLWFSINRMLQDEDTGDLPLWKRIGTPRIKDGIWTFLKKILLWILYLLGCVLVSPVWLIVSTIRYDKQHEGSIAQRFYEDPAIKYLSKKGKLEEPSYISADMFSTTLINLLRKKRSAPTVMQEVRIGLDFFRFGPKAETKKQFLQLIENAAGDVNEFKKSIEAWYNETQDRATGWYKTRMQLILLVIGLVIAVGFNVDSVGIAKTLMNNHDLAQKVAAMATDSSSMASMKEYIVRYEARQAKAKPDTTIKDSAAKAVAISQLDSAKTYEEYKDLRAQYDSAKKINKILGIGPFWESWHKGNAKDRCMLVLGWFLTALALSLGAPFWFDLLNKLMALRGSGKNSDAEKAKKEESTFKPMAVNLKTDPNGHHLSENTVKDPVLFALSQQSNFLKSIPGVISVSKDFMLIATGGQMQRTPCIEVRHLDTCNTAMIPAVVTIFFNGKRMDIPVEKRRSGFAQPHTDGTGRSDLYYLGITNEIYKDTPDTWGTLTGIVQDTRTKEKYLFSCAHVLRGDNSDNQINGRTNIYRRDSIDATGVLNYYLHTNVIDIGWAKLTKDTTFSGNKDLYIKPPRIIGPKDADALLPLTMYGAVSGKKQGCLWNENASDVFEYPQGEVEMFNLLKITNIVNGKFNALSQGGDSGAIVKDSIGKPVGMVIGGNTQFTYAIRLSDVFTNFRSIGPL